jgi:hypothetical protein
MNAGSIPLVKRIIRSISLEGAHSDLANILALHTAGEVREYVLERTKKLLPELEEKGYLPTP